MATPGKNKVSKKEIYDYLNSFGQISKDKALGILANIKAESDFYSDAVEIGDVENKGIGLFQYTFPARKEAFLKAVPDWETNWKGQIDFALREPEAQKFLESEFDSPEEATKAFMLDFEKPKDQSPKAIEKRIKNIYTPDDIPEADPEEIFKTLQEQSKKEEEKIFPSDAPFPTPEQPFSQTKKDIPYVEPKEIKGFDVKSPEIKMEPAELPIDLRDDTKTLNDETDETDKTVVDNTSNVEKTIKQGPLDAIGGIGTVVSALVGAKALSKASQDPEILATPELSDAFNAELYQMEQLSKQGFAPEQEKAIRKDIQSAYDLGVENAIRGTAGDRAKFLAMTGALDTRRQSALLDFAAKDEAARQANRDKYRQMLSFKETYDRQNDMQIRAEKMQQAQLQQQTSSALGAAAIKTALDNIQGAKADMMQRQYIASLSNGVKTEKVGLFESLGLGKLENMFKKNNTEA